MNNNNDPSSAHKCKCGRYITLGEEKARPGIINYQCPTCFINKYAKPLTREEYYDQISRVFK